MWDPIAQFLGVHSNEINKVVPNFRKFGRDHVLPFKKVFKDNCNNSSVFFFGVKANTCLKWAITKKRCNMTDKFGRIVRNYCRLSCRNWGGLCTCKDRPIFKVKIREKTYTCATLPFKYCNLKVRRVIPLREFCPKQCKLCKPL